MKNKKILMFSAYYLPHLGGIEKYVHNLSKQLIKMGHDVTVVSCKYNDKLASEEIVDGIQIIRLPIYRFFASRYPIVRNNTECKKIFQRLAEEKYDYTIIHARFWTISMMGAEFTLKQKIPTMVIDHGSAHLTVNNKILDFCGAIYEHTLTGILKRKVKTYYAVSGASSKWLGHFGIKSSGILKNAINEGDYKNAKPKKYGKTMKFTYAGRLVKEKGILLVLDAFDEVTKKYANVELNIAGDGPLMDAVRKKCENKKKVHILGKLEHEELMKLLEETSVFLNPSFADAMPTGMLEAGMMKCALVGTKVGGIPEIIIDDKHGRLCEVTAKSVREAMEYYINNPEKIKEHGKNAREYILKEYIWDKTAEDVIKALGKMDHEKN